MQSIGLFRSRASLQAEILTLRHQLNVLRRKSPQRLTFTSIDRLVFAGLYRLAPGVLDALKIIRPETVIRWHRAGFRAYWRWKSRPRSGRPKTRLEIRQLIREMSLANPLWGAPRLHGELLKLGIDVGQTRRTYRSARMLRCRVPSMPPAGLYPGHFSVDFTISTSELDFRQAQVMVATQRFDPSASITCDSLLKTAAHFRIARAAEFIKGSPT